MSWDEHEKEFGEIIAKVPDSFHGIYNTYQEAWQGKDMYEMDEECHCTVKVVKCSDDGKYYTIYNL